MSVFTPDTIHTYDSFGRELMNQLVATGLERLKDSQFGPGEQHSVTIGLEASVTFERPEKSAGAVNGAKQRPKPCCVVITYTDGSVLIKGGGCCS